MGDKKIRNLMSRRFAKPSEPVISSPSIKKGNSSSNSSYQKGNEETHRPLKAARVIQRRQQRKDSMSSEIQNSFTPEDSYKSKHEPSSYSPISSDDTPLNNIKSKKQYNSPIVISQPCLTSTIVALQSFVRTIPPKVSPDSLLQPEGLNPEALKQLSDISFLNLSVVEEFPLLHLKASQELEFKIKNIKVTIAKLSSVLTKAIQARDSVVEVVQQRLEKGGVPEDVEKGKKDIDNASAKLDSVVSNLVIALHKQTILQQQCLEHQCALWYRWKEHLATQQVPATATPTKGLNLADFIDAEPGSLEYRLHEMEILFTEKSQEMSQLQTEWEQVSASYDHRLEAIRQNLRKDGISLEQYDTLVKKRNTWKSTDSGVAVTNEDSSVLRGMASSSQQEKLEDAVKKSKELDRELLKYKKLVKGLKSDLNQMKLEKANAEVKSPTHEESLNEAQYKLTQITQEYNEASEEISTLKKTVEKQQESIISLQEQVKSMDHYKKELFTVESKLKKMDSIWSSLEAAKEEKGKAIKKLDQFLTSFKEAFAKLPTKALAQIPPSIKEKMTTSKNLDPQDISEVMEVIVLAFGNLDAGEEETKKVKEILIRLQQKYREVKSLAAQKEVENLDLQEQTDKTIQTLQRELATVEQQNKKLQSKLSTVESQLKEVNGVQETVSDLNLRLQKREDELTQLQVEHETVTAKSKALVARQIQMNEEMEKLKEENKTSKVQLQEKDETIASSKKDIAYYENETQHLLEQNRQLELQVNKNKDALNEAGEAGEQSTRRMDRMQEIMDKQKKEYQNLKREFIQQKRELESAQKMVQNSDALFEQERAELKTAFDKNLKVLSQEAKTWQEEAKQLKSQLSSRQSSLEESESYWQKKSQALQERLDKQKSEIRDVISLKKEVLALKKELIQARKLSTTKGNISPTAAESMRIQEFKNTINNLEQKVVELKKDNASQSEHIEELSLKNMELAMQLADGLS